MLCEKCGKEHDGSFGSGRFCSRSCANARIISQATKNKIKNSLENSKHCKLCNAKIRRGNKTGYCKKCLYTADECKELRSKIGKTASSAVKVHRKKINTIYQYPKQTKNKITYIYADHNNIEINKWLNYLKSLNVQIPEHEIRQSQGYYVLTNSHKHTKGTHFDFEHKYIMQHILKNYKETYTVHHIDNNGLNNSIFNLLAFETSADHIRFHHSKYSWLIYNDKNHTFTTILKK